MSKLAILFPGQGAQCVGMGREWYESSQVVRDLYNEANDVVGYDLKSLCLEGPAELLDTTTQSQPAIFLTSWAALQVLKETEGELISGCQAAAGLSLGEYTALTLAGVLTFEDGLRLVKARGEAMQRASEQTPSGMVSILGLETEKVQELCAEARSAGLLEIANYLCPGNIVVSGENAACEQVAVLARDAGAIKVVPLAVAGAFHTKIMEPAAESLREVLMNTTFREPTIPVISNVDVQSHGNPEEIREILMRQLTSPVRWEESVRALLADGFDTFYEVGPGRVLRGLMKRINRKVAMNP